MHREESQGKTCKNIFKDGSTVISKERFTEKWAELICRMEKNKAVTGRGGKA